MVDCELKHAAIDVRPKDRVVYIYEQDSRWVAVEWADYSDEPDYDGDGHFTYVDQVLNDVFPQGPGDFYEWLEIPAPPGEGA